MVRWSAPAALLALLPACLPSFDGGALACGAGDPCLDGWSCLAGRCWPPGEGPDGGPVGDGGTLGDGGTDAGSGCAATNPSGLAARAGLGAAFLPAGSALRLEAFGGLDPAGQPSGAVQVDDLQLGNGWTVGGALVVPRAYFAIAHLSAVDGVVVFGGLSGDGGLTSMEESATPTPSATWSLQPPVLPVPTWAHAAVMEADDTAILSCGGIADGVTTASCYTLEGTPLTGDYLFDDAGWQPAPADLTHPRSHFAMVVGPDGRAYAVGGEGAEPAGAPSSTSWEVFDGSGWSCPLSCPSLNVPRVGAAAALLGTRLFVTGGRASLADGAGTAAVEYIDLDAGPAAGWQLAASMNQARYDHAVAALPNGHLRVLGGESDGCTLGAVEDFDPAANQWTVVAAP